MRQRLPDWLVALLRKAVLEYKHVRIGALVFRSPDKMRFTQRRWPLSLGVTGDDQLRWCRRFALESRRLRYPGSEAALEGLRPVRW